MKNSKNNFDQNIMPYLYCSSEKDFQFNLTESWGQMMCLIYTSISMAPSEQRVRDPVVGH